MADVRDALWRAESSGSEEGSKGSFWEVVVAKSQVQEAKQSLRQFLLRSDEIFDDTQPQNRELRRKAEKKRTIDASTVERSSSPEPFSQGDLTLQPSSPESRKIKVFSQKERNDLVELSPRDDLTWLSKNELLWFNRFQTKLLSNPQQLRACEEDFWNKIKLSGGSPLWEALDLVERMEWFASTFQFLGVVANNVLAKNETPIILQSIRSLCWRKIARYRSLLQSAFVAVFSDPSDPAAKAIAEKIVPFLFFESLKILERVPETAAFELFLFKKKWKKRTAFLDSYSLKMGNSTFLFTEAYDLSIIKYFDGYVEPRNFMLMVREPVLKYQFYLSFDEQKDLVEFKQHFEARIQNFKISQKILT